MTALNTNAPTWDPTYFFDGAIAVRRAATNTRASLIQQRISDPTCSADYYEIAEEAGRLTPHYWHVKLQDKYRLHPAVEAAVLAWRPKNWHQLLLEWPHVSETDPARLAYTRDDRAGLADRQTVTSVGKYLRRHWPDLPDHTIRDLDARYNPKVSFKLANASVKDMIMGVELGPRSCMKADYGSIPFGSFASNKLLAWLADPSQPEPPWGRHPYSVYDPRLGWSMATRTDADGEVMGRCLCWTDPGHADTKVFVRSYARNAKGDSSNSGSDAGLEAWLRSQGFQKAGAWPGDCLFLKLNHPTKSGWFMPYLDGDGTDDRRVEDYGYSALVDADVFFRSDSGEFLCDNTDGTVEDGDDDEDMTTCEDCGSRVHHEDTYSIGYYGDACVCSACLEGYEFVRAQRGGQRMEYYLPRSEACEVYDSWGRQRVCSVSYWVDNDQPPEGLVAIDGGYAELDDVVCCTDDEYRFPDDPDVVELAEECPDSYRGWAHKDVAWEAYDGRWFSDETDWHVYDGAMYPESECWQCDGTGLWYPDDVEAAEGNGMTCHPDYFDRCSRSAEWGDVAMAEYREESREPEPAISAPCQPTVQRVSELQDHAERELEG